MELHRFGMQEEQEEVQYLIEQSLMETHRDNRRTAGMDQVFSAIRQGDEERLRSSFLEDDGRGWTALHEAAVQKKRSVLELTLELTLEGLHGLDRRSDRGQTPLFVAVERGLVENASFLLEHQADPDCQDQDLESPLFVAIRSGRVDLVELLLSHGSRVNQQGCHGRQPLHEAARLGDLGVARLLLEAGADPDPRSDYGLTPLALAAQGGKTEVVEALLRKGADPRSQAQDGASVLYEASGCGDPNILVLLMEFGADANVAKQSGHVPLHRAAHRGHLQALKLLLPVTSVSHVTLSGISPLHSAAAGGHAPCVQALLDAGFDPNFLLHPHVRRNYDDERKSALFFAVSNDDVTSARLLLEGGATTDHDPIKCLQVALRLGNQQLIHLLLRFGANVNYFSKINSTHFPSALQYALTDQVVLRMLCCYGYDVQRCFECPYGERPHVPDDYEGWSDTVIQDAPFCEVIGVSWLRHLSGQVVSVLLDYVDHVTLCSKLRTLLMEQRQWDAIRSLQGNPRSLQHLCRLRIRECLGRLRLRADASRSFLPLPPRLKDFLFYRELDQREPG